jgi:hypothetical protein
MSPKKKDNVMCTLFIYSFQLISDEVRVLNGFENNEMKENFFFR